MDEELKNAMRSLVFWGEMRMRHEKSVRNKLNRLRFISGMTVDFRLLPAEVIHKVMETPYGVFPDLSEFGDFSIRE